MDIDPKIMAEKIKSGEYFREAKRIYTDLYIDPMADRYFYLLITAISLLILSISTYALSLVYPLTPQVPFTYVSSNIDEDLPVMLPVGGVKEDPNVALKRYLASEYIRRREEYDINKLEVDVRIIRNMSHDDVYKQWQQELDPANPESPIAKFQRHTTRNIDILSVIPLPKEPDTFEVIYDATVFGKGGVKKSRYAANISFRFAEVTVDQRSGKASPLDFSVTGYTTRRIEE